MKPLATSSERPPLLLRKTVLVCRGEDGGGKTEEASEGQRGREEVRGGGRYRGRPEVRGREKRWVEARRGAARGGEVRGEARRSAAGECAPWTAHRQRPSSCRGAEREEGMR